MTNERHLTALSDAFCGAYAENDCVTLKLCIDFVKELSEDLTQQRDQMREKLMHIIKQLFCAADFSEGNIYAIRIPKLKIPFEIKQPLKCDGMYGCSPRQ